MTEEDVVSLGMGKWSQPGVPHRDWRCVDNYDTFEVHGEDQFETCEMCEVMNIRFVHVMQHDDYPELLHCGCICAGHMEQNKARAKRRDTSMRNRAGRRERFPERKGWRVSAKGTPHIRVDGYHLMVVRRKGGFAVGVTSPGAGDPKWGRKTYKSELDAQLGCFDALEYMKERRGG